MKLSRKQVSIFPTQHGFLFLIILIAMMLGAVNYNNNAGFILVFLLGGMALISIFHSFKNLVGIKINYLPPLPVFAGQIAVFPILVKAPATRGRSITFSLADQNPVLVTLDRGKRLQLEIPARERGLLHPGFLTITSVYPFGLFTFRSTLPVAAGCLVYPRPVPGTFRTAGSGVLPDGDEETARQGPDDFQGLKQYQPGHSINRISWKALSRGRGLFVKDFTAEDNPCAMLDFDAVSGKNVETKLSRLCGLILTAEGRQMEYGLRLPGFVKSPARGKSHQHHCLKALAVFNLAERPRLQNNDGLDKRPVPGGDTP